MKIVLTPDWFLGHDVLIDFFSFLILFLFFVLSYRNYKISNNKNTLYLGIGFLLISFAEFSTILTKLVLYYDVIFAQQIGQVVITYNVVKSVDIFYYLGFFLQRLFTLLGFYIIYRLPLKKESLSDFILVVYFIFVSALLSNTFYYFYYLTVLIFLVLIINNYYQIYKKNKSSNTKVLIFALGLLTLSNIIFMFSALDDLYVAAQTIQLISYITLLLLIIRISKHGTKEKQK